MEKKAALLIVGLIIVSLWAGLARAAWTITPSVASEEGNYTYLKLACTSDGSSMSATDFMPYLQDQGIKSKLVGSTILVLDVEPGTGGVAPDATIDVTLSNTAGLSVWADTGISYSANTTGNDLSTDYGQYPALQGKMYLTINDVGDSGDMVTLYFLVYRED